MSACVNCAPKRVRYSAFPSRFVCIALRAFLSNASSVGTLPTTEEKIGLFPNLGLTLPNSLAQGQSLDKKHQQ